MSGRPLVVAALVTLGCAGCDGADVLDEALHGVPCAREVRRTLDEWGAEWKPLEAPPLESGRRTLRFPTRVMGEWIVLSAPSGGPSIVSRVTEGGAEGRLYSDGCDFERLSAAHESPSLDRNALFSDSDLREAVAAAERGLVVYTWSPHMPLSVDGYAEIAEAGAGLRLDVIPVLMAYGDVDFARREAERVGIPPEGIRQVDSVELIQRDAQLHAPSILVFAEGRTSAVLPGYRNADGYRDFLEAFLLADSE